MPSDLLARRGVAAWLVLVALVAPVAAAQAQGDERANAVVIDSGGRVLVGGSDGEDFLVARYGDNGVLDTSFGGTGVVTTDFGGPGGDGILDVALGLNDRLIAVGPSGSGVALARYRGDGSLDSSFGTGGKATPPFASYPEALLPLASGKLLIAGSGGEDPFLARLNANGTVDTQFGGGDGWVTFPYGDAFQGVPGGLTELAQDASGRILAAGRAFGTQGGLLVARFHPDGSLDAGFSGDGQASFRLPSPLGEGSSTMLESAFDLEPTSEGIYVAGSYEYSVPCSTDCFESRGLLLRLTGSGGLDPAFDGDGIVVTGDSYPGVGSGIWGAREVERRPRGGAYVGGNTFTTNEARFDFAVNEYGSQGKLLAHSTANFAPPTADYGGDGLYGLARRQAGGVVATGLCDPCDPPGSGENIALARFRDGGGLDTSFCVTGIVTTDLSGGQVFSSSCQEPPPPPPPPPPPSEFPGPTDPPTNYDTEYPEDSLQCGSPYETPLGSANEPAEWITRAANRAGGAMTAQVLYYIVQDHPALRVALEGTFKPVNLLKKVQQTLELVRRWQDKECRAAFITNLYYINQRAYEILSDLDGFGATSPDWGQMTREERLDDANLLIAECALSSNGQSGDCIGRQILRQATALVDTWWGL
jgi:uncharacterized delta-60 repeat protein